MGTVNLHFRWCKYRIILSKAKIRTPVGIHQRDRVGAGRPLSPAGNWRMLINCSKWRTIFRNRLGSSLDSIITKQLDLSCLVYYRQRDERQLYMYTFWASRQRDDDRCCSSRVSGAAGASKPSKSTGCRTADTGAKWKGPERRPLSTTCVVYFFNSIFLSSRSK